jgi:hypothetical protein
MHPTVQPKKALAALSLGLALLAPVGSHAAGVGGGSGGGNPPPPPPQGPFPMVAFRSESVSTESTTLCTRFPCTGAAVHTGRFTALDGQGFGLDYFISAKTTFANSGPRAVIGSCQLYASLAGGIVNIDKADITVPVSPGGNWVQTDGGQTVSLQGALCPVAAGVTDVGIICTDNSGGNSGAYIYNTVLTVTPFSTANSPIENRSASSERASARSACSPAP